MNGTPMLYLYLGIYREGEKSSKVYLFIRHLRVEKIPFDVKRSWSRENVLNHFLSIA